MGGTKAVTESEKAEKTNGNGCCEDSGIIVAPFVV